MVYFVRDVRELGVDITVQRRHVTAFAYRVKQQSTECNWIPVEDTTGKWRRPRVGFRLLSLTKAKLESRDEPSIDVKIPPS